MFFRSELALLFLLLVSRDLLLLRLRSRDLLLLAFLTGDLPRLSRLLLDPLRDLIFSLLSGLVVFNAQAFKSDGRPPSLSPVLDLESRSDS